MARIGPAEVRERYGVEPHQVPDFIALRGDLSDKLPGARGTGAKTAAALLRRFGNLEDLLATGRFVEEAEALKMNAKSITVSSSHVVLLSHPVDVAGFIDVLGSRDPGCLVVHLMPSTMPTATVAG